MAQLQQHWPGLEIHIEQVRTKGDAVTHVPLTKIGGDGVFVVEIERALQEKRIDVAVHSLKDLPTVQPQGLSVVVPGEREDARDVLITRQARDAGTLAPARIGTCSLRRTAQVRGLFPGAEIRSLRGNVDTRLRKLDAGEYDAIILASAGLHRLGIGADLSSRLHYLSFEQMLPAPGQGALGLEIRNDPELQALLAPLSDRLTTATTSAERMFMRRLGAGCYLPVAAYARVAQGQLILTGLVTSLDGQQQVRCSLAIPWTAESTIVQAEQLGWDLAERSLAAGADKIILALGVSAQESQYA